MPKLEGIIAGVLCLLLLPSCGSPETAAAENAVAAEANGRENALRADPAPPGVSADGTDGSIPPPDAVSHPDGFLPPAPAEPEPTTSNSSDPGISQRSTEDEYIRNGQ